MIEISVVIPTYNRLDTLKVVLEAFGRQTLPASLFELIVVDSLSDDGTEAFANAYKPPFEFRYIRQENRGRPGARNRGIRESKGAIIFFTDSDIIPENNLLEQHFNFHKAHINAAAVGWESRISRLEELERAKQNPGARFQIHSPDRKRLSWLYFLTGNASVPKGYLLQAGLFDERFQGYGFEDLELGYRLAKAGIEIFYLPEAVNYHLHPRTIHAKMEAQRHAGQNAVLFYRKHRDWRIRWLLGMNSFAFVWHAAAKRLPWLLSWLERVSTPPHGNKFAESILTQYHYIGGVKETWKK